MRPTSTALRHACALLSTLLLATLLVAASGAPATRELRMTSGSTYLCAGYAGCRAEGFSDAGYGAVNDRSYWNMYPGHNCTNYVAYRMIRAGMSPNRPFGYPGNATNWGEHMSDRVDGTPRVGAVAWWRAHDNGSGSAGHVAYVERVTSDFIVISEDSWGGTFHWRRIDRGSYRWPTGFIHLVDRTIENVRRPRVIGTAKLGEVLGTTDGRWNIPDARLQYRWVVGRRIVRGERGPTFALRPAHVGKRIRAVVIAQKRGWDSARKYTVMTSRVQPGEFALSDGPVITGAAVKGETLVLQGATFAPEPGTVGIQWFSDGSPIDGATGHTLPVDETLVGTRITAQVTASRHGYVDRSATADPTEVVREGFVTVVREATIPRTTRVGQRVSAEPGEVTPARGTAPTYQWLRDGHPIPNATDTTYRVAPDDFARTLGLRVTYENPTYVTAETTTTMRRAVRAGTRMRVDTRIRGRRNWVVMVVDVFPRRVGVPFQGEVTVKLGDRVRRLSIDDGRGIARFPRTAPGRYLADVRQHPNARFFGSHQRFRVRVQGP